MHSHSPQSALTIAAAMMRTVWGVLRGEVDFEEWVQNWINGIFRKLEEMLAQYRAGALQPVAKPQPRGEGAEISPEPRGANITDVTERVELAPRAKRGRIADVRDDADGLAIEPDCAAYLDGGAVTWRRAPLSDASCAAIRRAISQADITPIFAKIGWART